MPDSKNPTDPNLPGASTIPGASQTTEGTRSQGKEDVKERTRQTARDVKSTAQQQATGLLDQQKGMAADQTGRLAAVLHKMSEQFDEQDQHQFSSYANNLARSTDALSERLRDKDIDTLLTQAQDFSRRQPAVFIGGAIATGFLLARFMRSSGERSDSRHDHSQHGNSRHGYSQHSETQHTGPSGPIA